MLFQALMLGILLFQVLYSLVQWLSSRRNEFIYYAGYAIILAGYFFLKYQAVNQVLYIGNLKIKENVLDRQLVYFAIYIYVEFGRSLLGSVNNKFALNKQIGLARKIMLVYIFASLTWSIVSQNNAAQEIVHVIFGTITFSFFLYVLVAIYKAGYKLGRLLVLGSLLMGLGAMTALFVRVYSELTGFQPAFKPIIFLEIGVIFELVCLNTALIYKTKRREDTQGRRRAAEAQKQLTNLQTIRSEISTELQVELVDGLSDIKLLSDAVQQRTGNASSPELQRISENSERLIKSMNEIVWSLNQHNDKLDNMITYLQDYALQLMQQVNLNCKVAIPENIPAVWVYSDARRNIFLAFKEAVHNIVKHSEATEVSILFSVSDHLHISIKDNGKGVNLGADNREFGNGLNNMKKRMKMLKGHFTIKAVAGTHIVFTMPLSSMTYTE